MAATAMPRLIDTGDETLNGLLAGYRDHPTEGFRRGIIADRLEELGQDRRARLVRTLKHPKVAAVAQRLWPGCFFVHKSSSWSPESREEVHRKRGTEGKRFICTQEYLCNMIEGRMLLVDPEIAEATEIERCVAVLNLFKE